jgi:hypothetical protein
VIIGLVGISSGVQQAPHNLEMTVLRSDVKSRVSVIIS